MQDLNQNTTGDSETKSPYPIRAGGLGHLAKSSAFILLASMYFEA